MGPFEMVVLIVLISVGAGVINNYLKVRATQADEIRSQAEVDEVLAEVERLKERVRVLEKIITDNDRHLADEIRNLA